MQEAQINPFRGHQTMDNMRQRYAADHPEPVSRFVVEKNVPMPDFFAASCQRIVRRGNF